MKKALAAVAAFLALQVQVASTQVASAEDWPVRPISMIVPYTPGGTTDLLARLAADAIGKALGQPVVVENKPGAGGIVGATLAARAKPDGYTILFGNNATNVVQPLINPAVQYDPLKSFTGIATIADAASFLAVGAHVPAKNLQEFIAYLKTHADAKYGTAGVGSMGQFTTELFLEATGTKATHIPYKGSNDAMTATIAGEVTFLADPVAATQVKSGKLQLLATLTAERYPNLADVPTAREQGVDVAITGWFGIFAPKGLSADKVTKLSGIMADLVKSESYRAAVYKMGIVPFYRNATAVDAQVADDLKAFSTVRDKANIRIQ